MRWGTDTRLASIRGNRFDSLPRPSTEGPDSQLFLYDESGNRLPPLCHHLHAGCIQSIYLGVSAVSRAMGWAESVTQGWLNTFLDFDTE